MSRANRAFLLGSVDLLRVPVDGARHVAIRSTGAGSRCAPEGEGDEGHLHAEQAPRAKGTLKAGRLLWPTELQPTPLSRSYGVEIVYGPSGYPRVRVLDELATRDGKSLPHRYSDGTLCLHEADDWTSGMSIADSIVPWTAEWLANYEIWLATADWHGGGEWPPRRSAVEPADEVKDPPASAADRAAVTRPDLRRGWR